MAPSGQHHSQGTLDELLEDGDRADQDMQVDDLPAQLSDQHPETEFEGGYQQESPVVRRSGRIQRKLSEDEEIIQSEEGEDIEVQLEQEKPQMPQQNAEDMAMLFGEPVVQ